MPIYFRNSPVTLPFMFDSVGNHWIQESTCRPNGYPCYHYLQTEKGCGRIEIRGRQYILREHEGILTAPFVPHSYTRESDEWQTAFATFTGTLASGIPEMLQNRPVIFTDREQGFLIESLISSAVTQYQEPVPDLQVLSSDCYRILLHFTGSGAYRPLFKDELYRQYVAPIVKEIETHYSEELTAGNLSSLVYVTPQYLSRLFRRFLGCSVYEYLTMYRINRAKELLLTDASMKIQDVAQACGFTDASHFIAMFRKSTGITPLDFRKMY
nr:helix-turn-helix transcriptional regulator [uncultured Blautia sp.]